MVRLTIAPDVFLWREKFSPQQQKELLDDVLARLKQAPLYRPVMPGNAKPFSVEESNFGALGWVSDKTGYRYQATHPMTGAPWPAIPEALLELWDQINGPPPPECCLVNVYGAAAKMGLHQDRDERDTSAAVIGVSLGDEALFRIGGTFLNGKWGRGGKTASVQLASGDVIAFGGAARLAYHGIDRIRPGTSRLVPGGGRLSLTLRRVGMTLPLAESKKKPPAGGGRGLDALDIARGVPGGDEPATPAKTGAESERGAVPAAQGRLQEVNYAGIQQVSRKFEDLKDL